MKKHATADESLLAQQPASIDPSAQSTAVTSMPNPVLAGGRSPDNNLNR